MSSLIKRILLFIIVTPIIGVITLFLPFYNHLVLNILLIAGTVFCTKETAQFFIQRDFLHTYSFILPFAGILPASAYLEVIGVLPFGSLLPIFLVSAGIILAKSVFIRESSDFSRLLTELMANITLLVYPILFSTFIIKLSMFENARYCILLFFMMTFFNDASAYAFGMLFGKRKRVITPVSPNKTAAGFIAGFLTSIFIAVLTKYFLPAVFTVSYGKMIFIGTVIGIVCILGDLVESAIKRSARVKDSGDVVPGRGGLLDSLDSLIFSAPIYFYLLKFIL